MIQLYIVIIILTAAMSYAGYRIYKVLTDVSEACRGCALAEKCSKKQKKSITWRKNRENIWQCRK